MQLRVLVLVTLLSVAAASPGDAQSAPAPSSAGTVNPATGTRAAGPLDALAFMAGCWRSTGDASTLEEYYTPPSANLMLGVSRFMRDGRAVQYEFSRITADSNGVVLLPFPNGKAAEFGFRLTQSAPGSVMFEAPEHDFPRRIHYSTEADGGLRARIDGGAGDARVQEWQMRPTSCSR